MCLQLRSGAACKIAQWDTYSHCLPLQSRLQQCNCNSLQGGPGRHCQPLAGGFVLRSLLSLQGWTATEHYRQGRPPLHCLLLHGR